MRMPRNVMEAFLIRIPIYQAEDALMNAQIAMLPVLKDDARRRIIRTWQRIANRAKVRVITDVREFQKILSGEE